MNQVPRMGSTGTPLEHHDEMKPAQLPRVTCDFHDDASRFLHLSTSTMIAAAFHGQHLYQILAESRKSQNGLKNQGYLS